MRLNYVMYSCNLLEETIQLLHIYPLSTFKSYLFVRQHFSWNFWIMNHEKVTPML